VRKLINDIESSPENQLGENQLARKLTILDAVHTLKKAWSAVTSTTIVNCFKKGGFHMKWFGVLQEYPIIPNILLCDIRIRGFN
jgi:hypothetical protein